MLKAKSRSPGKGLFGSRDEPLNCPISLQALEACRVLIRRPYREAGSTCSGIYRISAYNFAYQSGLLRELQEVSGLQPRRVAKSGAAQAWLFLIKLPGVLQTRMSQKQDTVSVQYLLSICQL